MTLGEYRVGITFNPGGNEHVNEIKRRVADLIDFLEDQRHETAHLQTDAERFRLLSLAQTHLEDAAMWGVKAVTKGSRNA
jgi:hypothetical protein